MRRVLPRAEKPGNGAVLAHLQRSGPGGPEDDEAERIFKVGTMAIMKAIEEHGSYPIES